MFDISKLKIDIPCPNPECTAKIKVKLEQVEKQESVTCSSCQKDITLTDKNKSTQRGIKDVNKSVKSLKNTIRKTSR